MDATRTFPHCAYDKVEQKDTHANFEMFEPVKKKNNVFLYFTALIVNIMSIVTGIASAWSSPVFPKLQSLDDNPLGYVLTVNQISWLASLLSLGCAIGPFAGGYLADKFGRKITLAATAVPMIATFIILSFGNYLTLYYIMRLIMGICGGIYLTVIPMYIGEIAEVHNRGTIGTFASLTMTFGFLFAYALGPYVSIFWFNLYCVIPSIIFLIIFIPFIPESPSYYIMKNREEGARKSLNQLRTGDVEDELLETTLMVKEFQRNRSGILDVFKTKHLLKSLTVMMTLGLFQQLTGIAIIVYYLQSIFDAANTSISTDLSAIIIGIIQIVGVIIASFSVDKLGRRPLLLFSNTATSIALLTLSTYFYLQEYHDVTNLGWLPLATLVFYIFSSNLGMRSLPFAIMGEVFPLHVKPAASAITVSFCFIVSFIIVKVFPIIADLMGNWFAYLLLGICNFSGTFFIWFFVPETKGKTLTEIIDSFK